MSLACIIMQLSKNTYYHYKCTVRQCVDKMRYSPCTYSCMFLSLCCADSFKTLYGQLRELKTEIEHIQHLLEKAKMQLQRDFEQWWSQQSANSKVALSTCLCIVVLASYSDKSPEPLVFGSPPRTLRVGVLIN